MTDQPLWRRFRAVVCDLDGVVYHGPEAVPGAADALNTISARVPVVYATNNASRAPSVVAEHLRELGILTDADQVITSSVAGARCIADRLGAGSAVLSVGGPGVSAALEQHGLRPVAPSDVVRNISGVPQGLPQAVLQGYGADVRADDLALTAYAVQGGALWVATNTDRTLPTAAGIAPGNGTLVAAVQAAVEVEPIIIGKPGPAMYELAATVAGVPAGAAVGVGDRLETDTAGARAAGMVAAHVLTGVHDAADVAGAPPELRPDLLVDDLSGFLDEYEPAVAEGSGFVCGHSAARPGAHGSARIEVSGDGITAVRAAVALAWSLVDDGSVDTDGAADLVRSSVGS